MARTRTARTDVVKPGLYVLFVLVIAPLYRLVANLRSGFWSFGLLLMPDDWLICQKTQSHVTSLSKSDLVV